MGNFCLQNHRWKTASPYGQFQKLSVAQALSLTLRKPAQSICMLFIVELKNWWLIIYVLLVCLRVRQPAKSLSTPASQARGTQGRPRTGAAATFAVWTQTMVTVWEWIHHHHHHLPVSLKKTILKSQQPCFPFLIKSTKCEFVEKQIVWYKTLFCSLSEWVPHSAPSSFLQQYSIPRKKGSHPEPVKKAGHTSNTGLIFRSATPPSSPVLHKGTLRPMEDRQSSQTGRGRLASHVEPCPERRGLSQCCSVHWVSSMPQGQLPCGWAHTDGWVGENQR